MVTVKTYEDLMKSYLFNLPADMDRREGTLAHLLMSVTAMGIAELYEQLADTEANAYGHTATGNMLDKTVEIIGLKRIGKMNAVVRVETADNLFVGDVLTGGDMKYTVEEIGDGYCLAKCNTAGKAGNSYTGELLCERDGAEGEWRITAFAVAGSDEEDDESLRQRYLERLFCPVCTGNVSYYKDAIHSIAGVGGIKIESAYDGAGTVKVIITDNEFNAAGEELINYVKEYLDPKEYSGLGYGVVPIGHRVEVESAEKVDIHIQLEINGGEATSPYVGNARIMIKQEVAKLNREWAAKDNIVIWNRLIEDAAFKAFEHIRDVKVLSINGDVSRFILGKNQIIGDVYINEE